MLAKLSRPHCRLGQRLHWAAAALCLLLAIPAIAADAPRGTRLPRVGFCFVALPEAEVADRSHASARYFLDGLRLSKHSDSFSRPTGNVTGVTNGQVDALVKAMSLLKEAANVRRIVFLYAEKPSPGLTPGLKPAAEMYSPLVSAARDLQVAIAPSWSAQDRNSNVRSPRWPRMDEPDSSCRTPPCGGTSSSRGRDSRS